MSHPDDTSNDGPDTTPSDEPMSTAAAPATPGAVETPLIEPRPWTVRAVRGRQVEDAEPGLPRLSEITLSSAEGQVRTFGVDNPLTAGRERLASGRVVASAQMRVAVSSCLICETTDGPWSDEHLPPKHFGGRTVLVTCRRCNNGLGSRTESALLDWYDQVSRYTLWVAGRPDPIAAGRAGHYSSDDGEALLDLVENWGAEQGRSLFPEHAARGEEFEIEIEVPSPAQYLTAALKQAFLAACVLLGGVPADAPSVAEIRAELLAARDAPRRADVALGPRARGVGLRRTGLPAHGTPVTLVQGTHDSANPYLICLAGTLLVDWPFPEVDPRAWRGQPWPWSLL